MKVNVTCIIAVIMAAVFFSGCAYVDVHAKHVRNPDLSILKSFYVVHNADDTGTIDEVIKDALLERGFEASCGPGDRIPDHVDAVVTYNFHWFWDITNYLLYLKVHLRNPETQFPVAMGESLRTSLARKTPEEMAREVLDTIFKDPEKPVSSQLYHPGFANI